MTKQEYLDAGWQLETVSLYDEEGVEGWRWTSPDGKEYYGIGLWDEEPPLPEECQ